MRTPRSRMSQIYLFRHYPTSLRSGEKVARKQNGQKCILMLDSPYRLRFQLWLNIQAEKLNGRQESLLSCAKQHRLASALCELYGKMEEVEMVYRKDLESHNSIYLSIQPVDVIHALRERHPTFTAFAQHDAQELLRCLLSYLQELSERCRRSLKNQVDWSDTTNGTDISDMDTAEHFTDYGRNGINSVALESPLAANAACLSKEVTSEADFVVGMFQGGLVFTTKCLECESSSGRHEKFLDVSVPVKRFKSSPETPRKQTAVGQNSLNWSLKQFTKPERLTGEDKYYCGVCNRHSEAEISMCFDKLPPILTIHLKRFTALAGGGQSLGFVTKLSGNLATPMHLRLHQWCTRDCENKNQTYELLGVIMHNGCGTGSGHYLTYVRASGEAEKWMVGENSVAASELKENFEKSLETVTEDYVLKDDADTSPISGSQSVECARVFSSSLSGVSDIELDITAYASLWKWLRFDDCDVEIISHADFLRAISPSSVVTSTPYILFYQFCCNSGAYM
ncbi:ubiquitin carboxyl-terminal hydrolase 1-like isoform X2 [Corticium candelabrum]|uniref:ubiquitin carboxyl-terminal hydrolase 1-like isoform X2 n=1 Tax=Corticium candelabrum TaxID=121492 RepID=UPI002E30269E|nr:ubiquitin carboxyl-terminal hydrolase 1-like isoform X2 [Corticium candelabrum]